MTDGQSCKKKFHVFGMPLTFSSRDNRTICWENKNDKNKNRCDSSASRSCVNAVEPEPRSQSFTSKSNSKLERSNKRDEEFCESVLSLDENEIDPELKRLLNLVNATGGAVVFLSFIIVTTVTTIRIIGSGER